MTDQSTTSEKNSSSGMVELDKDLKFLTPDQILMIDDMLEDVKPYGEVTLRVEEGKLTFAAESKSYDALKLQRPNAFEEEVKNES